MPNIYFAGIPRYVFENYLERMTYIDFKVYGILRLWSDKETGVTWMTQERIAELAFCSVASVKRALNSLYEMGLVTQIEKGRTGKASVYDVGTIGEHGRLPRGSKVQLADEPQSDQKYSSPMSPTDSEQLTHEPLNSSPMSYQSEASSEVTLNSLSTELTSSSPETVVSPEPEAVEDVEDKTSSPDVTEVEPAVTLEEGICNAVNILGAEPPEDMNADPSRPYLYFDFTDGRKLRIAVDDDGDRITVAEFNEVRAQVRGGTDKMMLQIISGNRRREKEEQAAAIDPFTEFLSCFQKRVNPGEVATLSNSIVEEAYKANPQNPAVTHEKLLEAAKGYRRFVQQINQEYNFQKNPLTWLKDRGWEANYPPEPPKRKLGYNPVAPVAE